MFPPPPGVSVMWLIKSKFDDFREFKLIFISAPEKSYTVQAYRFIELIGLY